jgi:hypothetical protein
MIAKTDFRLRCLPREPRNANRDPLRNRPFFGLTKLFMVLSLLFLFTLLANRLSAQFTACPYPTGAATLCEQHPHFNPTVTIQTPTSTSSFLNSSWVGQSAYLDAALTVNTPFSISNSVFKMGPNGKIIVSNGNLNCILSSFFSCAASGWAGIRAEVGAQVTFVFNHVEDAQNAIDIASSAATLVIASNYFNRNNIGIRANIVSANALVAGNTFDCTSNTYTGFRSEAGIRIAKAFLAVFRSSTRTSRSSTSSTTPLPSTTTMFWHLLAKPPSEWTDRAAAPTSNTYSGTTSSATLSRLRTILAQTGGAAPFT